MEAEKRAYGDGFSAGWDIRLALEENVENPYDQNKQWELYIAWQNGFDAAERES